RFFLRDLPPERLWGIDCAPDMIDFCRRSNRWCRFELTPPMPPTPLPAESFDFIYAFSVFSHLGEAPHLRILEELRRLLRPGGLLVVTTRPRDWFSWVLELRSRKETLWYLPPCFPDMEKTLAEYDAGRFCHEPTGGGGVLSSSF